MAPLQILKSSSPFSLSFAQNDFRLTAEFNPLFCGKRILKLSNTRRRSLRSCNGVRVFSKLKDGENQTNGEEPPESLFMKELRRRGMTPTSLLEESNRSTYGNEETDLKEEDGGFWRRNAVSTDSGRNLTNQREQSMALNSEGLEGLIPRAKLLLTLGGTFFLAFWPLILVTVVFFIGLYLYFGPAFVHDGSSTPVAPPQYIDPYALLEEERISQIAPPLN